MTVECAMLTCRLNDKSKGKYGLCRHPAGIVLKWRLAADLGKGSLVLMECLNMDIEEQKENADGN